MTSCVPSRPGLGRPHRLRREIAFLLLCKLAALVALYLAFFSPSHRPAIDPSALFAGRSVAP